MSTGKGDDIVTPKTPATANQGLTSVKLDNTAGYNAWGRFIFISRRKRGESVRKEKKEQKERKGKYVRKERNHMQNNELGIYTIP